MLADTYAAIRRQYRRRGKAIPRNKGKRRDLDCLVINKLVRTAEQTDGIRFQTVRCPFLEGEPAFPGSAILHESHVQIAVRDRACITSARKFRT